MKKILLCALACALTAVLLSGCLIQDLIAGGKASGEEELTRGTCVDNIYASEYANLVFLAPEGWTYATDEEMAETMGVGLEVLQDSGLELNEKILEQKVIYDMMAVDSETGVNVIVSYENMALTFGGDKLTEADYLDICKSQLESVETCEYAFGDVTEQQIGEDTYQAILAEVPELGLRQYYCVRKVGKYMLSIVVSAFEGDDIAEILNCFSSCGEG